MKSFRLLLACCAFVYASETVFSVNDDIYAFPHYDIVFSDSYISRDDALIKLQNTNSEWPQDKTSDISPSQDHAPQLERPDSNVSYDYLVLHDRSYLCSFPIVEAASKNKSEMPPSPAEQEKELIRAADRGRQLLQEMEGNQCLFYSTGWWTYSFCYNSYVKQFHALSPGSNGGNVWPPQEDPSTPSYLLGKYERKTSKDLPPGPGEIPSQSSELQTKADTTYLTQQLSNGTPCDLTGKNRRIEIQFHCNPQLTDRIGLIKETSTCAYLMVVYTPRLCNDVAFLPPQAAKAHSIVCQEILTEEEIDEYESQQGEHQEAIEEAKPQPVMVGDIQVGALQILGPDGKRLERGRVVMTPEEKAEIVIQQKDGNVRGMSEADLRKRQLNPDVVDEFRKELEKMANGKDWKIERFDAPDGHVQLRGVVTSVDDKKGKKNEVQESDGDEGSDEVMKDEL